MIAIENGKPCPFCRGKNKFINKEDNDLLKHLQEKHPNELVTQLFIKPYLYE